MKDGKYYCIDTGKTIIVKGGNIQSITDKYGRNIPVTHLNIAGMIPRDAVTTSTLEVEPEFMTRALANDATRHGPKGRDSLRKRIGRVREFFWLSLEVIAPYVGAALVGVVVYLVLGALFAQARA
ncbi:hypothetical protein [Arcanobacterium haemolyticum]